MACSYLDRILLELWPRNASAANKIWAILDCARDERIYRALESTGRDKCCLYSGRLDPVLKTAAPHLVKLEYADRFTQVVIDEGWGNHWGIFLQADASLEELRLHLKRFLRARDEQRRRFLFRFYDPRVLRVYLPTCTPEEASVFFGPISRFFMEGEDLSGLVTFTLQQKQLTEQNVQLLPTYRSAWR